MQLTHSFTVPAPVEEAFTVLRDVERIAPCMPGATLGDVDGDTFHGKVKVKVGPIQVTYAGTARFTEVDEDRHRATLTADAKESRGSGTARATVTAECRALGEAETAVTVFTDLAVTGKPAQFGRGVMSDVGEKLLGKFADCLAEELASPSLVAADDAAEAVAHAEAEVVAGTPATSAEGPSGEAAIDQANAQAEPAEAGARDHARGEPRAVSGSVRPPTTMPRRTSAHRDEAIDLLDLAGGPVLTRLAPLLVGGAVIVLLVWLVRRRR